MFTLIIIALTLSAEPTTLTGKIVGVHDGDTVTMLDATNAQIKVRLAGIDAPELKQPFGTRSKEALSELVFGKQVRVESTGKDRYGRTLGTIWLGEFNVNLLLVQGGWAWHYRQYDKSEPLASAEKEARAKQAGLWADKNPTAPWDWRKAEKAKNAKPPTTQATPRTSPRFQPSDPRAMSRQDAVGTAIGQCISAEYGRLPGSGETHGMAA